MSYKLQVTRRSFSIVELMTTLTIIVILIALSLSHYQAGEKKVELDSEVKRLISVLRLAQNRALAGLEVSGALPNGYGVYISSDGKNYKLFADTSATCPLCYDTSDTVIQDLNIPQLISISNPTNKSILFERSKSKIYFDGLTSPDSLTITLTHSQTGKTQTLEINRLSGKID